MLTTIEKVLLLQGVGSFGETETENLARIAAIATEIRFAKGETIFKEGDPVDAVYIVVEGTVLIRMGSNELFIKEKEAFGWGDMFEKECRRATAVASSPVMALTIEREAFLDLLADHFDIVRGMLHYYTTLSVHLDYMTRVTRVPNDTTHQSEGSS
jgi:CRP-like cAMP-binding protein